MSTKMGHVRSKTRSLVQILEKHCVRSTDHIFSLIILKPGQVVCLMKSRTSSNLRKTLCTLYRPHFQSDNPETWSGCLSYEISDEFNYGSCHVKN